MLPPDGRGPRATSPMTRVPILMYHSITDSPTPVTRRHAVRPADFAEQMAYLKESGFTPITFGDLASALGLHGPPLRGEPAPRLPDKPIVITFDDGYADFHDTALPVLDKYGFRCTLFLTTGWVRDAGAAAAGRPPGPTLCWSQVREAADHGVEIGGHSHSHPQLDQLPTEAIRAELRDNKALLEDLLGRPVTTMAYPFGYHSARVREEVVSAGYAAACAVRNAVAAIDRCDALILPRLTVGPSTSMARFRLLVHDRGIPLIYLKERILTAGYAVVRRAKYGLNRISTRR
ncbi:polysaccharide deacetylase [Thermobispora bispora DSM 43833]|uniref:Polysaccharide deacetylase n=2 Tax=Thermobispora bispora TaxID=2006 RepID=D6Y5I2_THEBD|nr:polysaccharide deacetylase [Thermobispora bispora DSM 43833]